MLSQVIIIWRYGFIARFFLASFTKDTGEAKRINDMSMAVLEAEYKKMGKMSYVLFIY